MTPHKVQGEIFEYIGVNVQARNVVRHLFTSKNKKQFKVLLPQYNSRHII